MASHDPSGAAAVDSQDLAFARADLDHGAVLWLVALEHMPRGAAVLDASERERLASLRSPALARRYAARRFALRVVLGAALDIAPQLVPLELGPHGKPRVAGERSLSFNLSHRGETAVIALARASAVGVDIESARTRGSPQRLAERFFHPAEAAAIAALPPPLATEAFLRCWTAKEAVLKAIGSGLSTGMREVVLAPDPCEPLHLLNGAGGRVAEEWTLHQLCLPAQRLTLALALPQEGARIAAVHGLPDASRAGARSSRLLAAG